jgi:hypothetical protein
MLNHFKIRLFLQTCTPSVAHTAHPHHLDSIFFRLTSAETLKYMSNDSIMQRPCLCHVQLSQKKIAKEKHDFFTLTGIMPSCRQICKRLCKAVYGAMVPNHEYVRKSGYVPCAVANLAFVRQSEHVSLWCQSMVHKSCLCKAVYGAMVPNHEYVRKSCYSLVMCSSEAVFL